MCKHVKTQTKRRETRLIYTFSSKHVLEHIVLSWRKVDPPGDSGVRGGCDYGISCHSEGLAEESQCLVANASNFALTPPQRGRLGGGQPTQQDKNGGVAC
jgi:hypothetical protein